MNVELEDDAVPIVRIIGAMARRSLQDPAVAKHVRRANGVAVLQSATDPQAVTLRYNGKTVYLERGIAPDAGVTITADLADDSVKPKVSGAARHPLVAVATGKLLEPPIGAWRDEAEQFMSGALKDEDCPRPIKLVATNTGESKQWGGEGDPALELHGSSEQLASAMSGSSLAVEDVLSGKLYVVGDLSILSRFTKLSIAHTFGEF